MKDSITLSDKHGVNPSLGICPICHEDNGEILLMGRLPFDAEAPHRVPTLHPCDTCKALLTDATALIEAEGTQERPVLTGRVAVIKRSGLAPLLNIPLAPIMLVEPGVLDRLLPKEDETP
jgi:hypothetical protein